MSHKKYNMSWVLLASASVSLMASAAASAQEPTRRDEATTLEDVIVTVTKRATDLQKTPAAVNVVTAQQLNDAAITKVEDIQMVIPGVDIYANANATGAGAGTGSRNNITIRGVGGGAGGDPSSQPSAAIVIDGVYSQAGTAGVGGLVDIAQIEVLKGPQGTLYGRNATIGVISFVTQNPKFENSGQANAEVGNFGRVNTSGIANFMLSDSLAVRLAAQVSRRDGYYKDGLSNQDTYSARLKVLFKPNDNLSVLLAGEYAKDNSYQNGSTVFSAATGDVVGDPWAKNLPTGADAVNFYSLYFQGPPRDNENYGLTTQVDWGLGWADLTVIGAYRRALTNEVGPTYIGTLNDSDETSLEARLASSDANARLKWLVGGYYYDQNITGTGVNICSFKPGLLTSPTTSGAIGDYDISQAGLALNASSPCGNTAALPTTTYVVAKDRNNDQKNYSFFTQETFSVLDNLRVTGGARWQYEKAVRGAVYDEYYNGTTRLARLLSGRLFGQTDWTAITWKLGVDMDLGPRSLIYATASTGWKAGTPLQYEAPYDQQRPEELTSYVFGSKNRFLENRLQVNGEIFYWDFKNRQISQTVNCVGGVQTQVLQRTNGVIVPVTCIGFLNPPNGGVFVQGNAKKSHIQGASGDVLFRATSADTISVALEYIEEAVHDDMGGQAVNGCLFKCKPNLAPKWSGVVSYRRTFEMADGGRVVFDARAKGDTRKLLAIAATAKTQMQDAYMMFGTGLSYTPAGEKWNIRAYIENLTDEVVKTQADAPGAGQVTARGNVMPPRTYGVQLHVNF